MSSSGAVKSAGFAALCRKALDAFMRAIYAAHVSETGTRVMGSGAARARIFSRALSRAIDADERAAHGEVGSIDADPFTDSQDSPSHLDLKISVLSASAANASVLAGIYLGYDDREQLTYSLVMERGQWRVDDIAYSRVDVDGSKRTLRGMLRGLAAREVKPPMRGRSPKATARKLKS